MSFRGDQIKSALGVSALVSFYGIAGLLVYFLGQSLGVGLAWQVAIIGLILLTWPFAIVIGRIRARRARKQENVEAEGAPSGGSKAGVPPKRVSDELSRGAEEAVEWLRSSLVGGTNSKRSVYALPWFVVSGPPASGKTSLLLASGLNFHALPSQRASDFKIVRPNRHCDWRMSDSGVFIDTPGRYQSEGPARDEWMALLDMLRKYRSDRPLDGFLIVCDIKVILTSNEADIEQMARTLRARLDELINSARTRFPVYLLFTHIDAISGFRDFFSGAGEKATYEVFGTTIPLEKSPSAHALFDVEFNHLYRSLSQRRLLLLQGPRSAKARLNVFDFPWRFRDIQSKLGLFISMMFRPNPFSETPLLRGFYFTGNVSNEHKPQLRAVSAEVEVAKPVGRGYFTDRFFREVLFRDENLAASFQALRKRPSRRNFYLLAAGVVALLALAAGATISYIGNAQLLLEATERGTQVEKIRRADLGKDVTKKDIAAARDEIEAVEKLRETLANLDDFDRNSPPLRLRFGLYLGNSIQGPLRTIYFDSISQRYVKSAGAGLEQDLRDFAEGVRVVGTSSDGAVASGTTVSQNQNEEDVLGHNYDLLKAYKMLSDRSRVDPTFLAAQLESYWRKTSPDEKRDESLQQLQFFASQAAGEDAPQYPVDTKLIENVQQKLTAYPAYKRYYKQLISEVNNKTSSVSVSNSDEIVGTYSVPGSFTIDGYRNYMKAVFESKAEEINKDDWVLGSATLRSADNEQNMAELKRIYWDQYSDHWRKFLKSIRVRPFDSAASAAASLRELSANSSALTEVLNTVVRNTQISANPKGPGLWQWIKSFFESKTSQDTAGKTPVEVEFQPLFEFVGATEGSKDLSGSAQYRNDLLQISNRLDDQTKEKLTNTAKNMLEGKDELGLQKAERTTDKLSKTTAATDAASLLKQPIENVRALLYKGVSVEIEQEWSAQLLPRARKLEEGYPFTDSASDTSVTDLAQFLNPATGKFSLFINKLLVTSIDGTPGQWQRKPNSSISISDEFLKYLNDTARLREALFQNSGSQQPEVGYQVTLQPTKDADVSIELYGTSLHAQDNPENSPKLTWPATGGSLAARITATPRATSDPGQPLGWSGEWALFKWFEAGNRGSSSPNEYKLSWAVNSIPVQATLTATTANHPFNKGLFRNWRAPKDIH